MKTESKSEHQFTSFIDKLQIEGKCSLQHKCWEKIVRKCLPIKESVNPDMFLDGMAYQRRVVEEEYMRQAKKIMVITKMRDCKTHQAFTSNKLPIKLKHTAAQYLAVTYIPEYHYFKGYSDFLIDSSWMETKEVMEMNRKFMDKYIDFSIQRYFKMKKADLHLPLSLTDFQQVQKTHLTTMVKNIQNNWRDFLMREMQHLLGDRYALFSGDEKNYENSDLSKIIRRYDIMYNSHIRNFVKLSIEDLISFVKSFTTPSDLELFALTKNPLFSISMSLSTDKESTQPESKDQKETKDENEK